MSITTLAQTKTQQKQRDVEQSESTREETSGTVTTVVLNKKPRTRRVMWANGVIDNEGMGKKSSKCCCVFHKRRAWDESSSDDEDGAHVHRHFGESCKCPH
eukprot:TRINITY_DN7778_c0_g1_i1.p1 TRINITY_DN7778_c0_g1~~TRINITY_DN7778_c0_g1_i1.p1  ORF type:complete len:101 (-),score=19.42 TRINITY_DN7778_c0_g1_i1:85-387(-)